MVVIGVGLVLAIIAVAVILNINPTPIEEQDDYQSRPAATEPWSAAS